MDTKHHPAYLVPIRNINDTAKCVRERKEKIVKLIILIKCNLLTINRIIAINPLEVRRSISFPTPLFGCFVLILRAGGTRLRTKGLSITFQHQEIQFKSH